MLNSGRYFEPLNPVAKEQYIEKLSLLKSTGDNGPYNEKALKNSVHHAALRVWSAVEFELIFATKSLMVLSILLTILIHS